MVVGVVVAVVVVMGAEALCVCALLLLLLLLHVQLHSHYTTTLATIIRTWQRQRCSSHAHDSNPHRRRLAAEW